MINKQKENSGLNSNHFLQQWRQSFDMLLKDGKSLNASI